MSGARRSLLVATLAMVATAVAPHAVAARQVTAAADPAASAARNDAHREAALRVIRLLYGPDVLRMTLERVLAWTLPDALATNPQMVELEKSYPGLRQKVLDVVDTDLVPVMLRRLPLLWDRLAPIYMRNLSPKDLDRMHAFYAGETGQRFLALVARASDYRSLADKQLASGGNARITQADAAAMWDASQNSALEKLSVAELDELIAMGKAVGNGKIERNDTEVAGARIAWANTPDPEINAVLEAKVTEFIAAYPSPR